jgi:transcriptional regulator with XRE-family HTH domain
MTVPAVTGEVPLCLWLRQQREARGLARREMARRLLRAGRAAGDTSVPGIESMYQNIRRWENGDTGPTERYRLYYCEVLAIPVAEFGRQAPCGERTATVSADGLSVSLRHEAGRLVIEISGLEAPEPSVGPGPGLALVTAPDPPKSYGGRA